MQKIKLFSSIKTKMHIFVLLTVLSVALGTAIIAYSVSANQIDDYYKRCADDNARNFASMVDADYLAELRAAAESDEFQELREIAEENDDESLIQNWLTEHGLWEGYAETQGAICRYLSNMTDIRYLYIVAHGDADAVVDMYLVDSDEEPIYQTGYYEDRETEFWGSDLAQLAEPTISNGDWGWLCSAFSPVYTDDGHCVCIVGCDFGMDDIMEERRRFRLYLFVGALVMTLAIQFLAGLFIQKTVANPLNAMTREMEKFKPAENLSYEEAGVMNLNISSSDEIGALYTGIRTMETNIIDRLNDLYVLQEHKRQAEQDIREKEQQIGQLSIANSRDSLTGVGSQSAYLRKTEELNNALTEGKVQFAVVMVDMNNLKQINDEYGHEAGDKYIKGCCHMICEAFKHSPVYRVGGDEFIAVLQGSDFDTRAEIFQALQDAFDRTYAQTEQEPWCRYSAALGMSENSEADSSFDTVLRRADQAMYQNKMLFKQKHGSYR